MPGRAWFVLGAALAFFGVAAGAFGAHGLENLLRRLHSEELLAKKLTDYLHNFDVAVRYQMYHALALLAVGLGQRAERRWAWNLAGGAFVLGTVLFSGLLYLLVLTGRSGLGAIVPLGGVSFLVGWVVLGFAASGARPK